MPKIPEIPTRSPPYRRRNNHLQEVKRTWRLRQITETRAGGSYMPPGAPTAAGIWDIWRIRGGIIHRSSLTRGVHHVGNRERRCAPSQAQASFARRASANVCKHHDSIFESCHKFVRPRITQPSGRIGQALGRAPESDNDFQLRETRRAVLRRDSAHG